MRYKIGVFGSAVDEGKIVTKKARELGCLLSEKKVVIITGACTGIPYEIAHEAARNGSEIWGYSPVLNIKLQKKFTPKDDLSIYTKIIYMPKNFEFLSLLDACKKYRNVISTANCDAGIIVAGRWGTMNEFTNLYDLGKIIGVLTGTGGIADELPTLCKKINKKSKAKIVFSSSPVEVVEKIIKELKTRLA